MKKSSHLTDYYYKKLYPTLKKLEKERVQLKHRVVVVGVIYSTFMLLFGVSIFKSFYSMELVFMLLFGYAAGGKFLYNFLIKDYKSAFKDEVIAPLIESVNPALKYFPQLHIDPIYFTRSRLFNAKADRVRGNDYVTGEIEGTKIQFSDFHAQKRYKDSKGRESYKTIFQGLFIVADFSKHFHGSTQILPDRAQRSFGDLIGHWLQSKNFARGELVKMDSPEFEKEFVVYSTDQVEARYILSPSLMSRILLYKKRTGEDLLISFTHSSIHLAIAYNKDLFEASLFHSLLDYKIALEYTQTLYLAIGIVEELKLNQRLWSKI